jgi:hypothetical protein
MKVYLVIYQDDSSEFKNIAICSFLTIENAEKKLQEEIDEAKKLYPTATITLIEKNKYKFECIGLYTGYWQIIESEVK